MSLRALAPATAALLLTLGGCTSAGTGDAEASSDTAGSASSEASGSAESGGVDLGICERLIECAQEAGAAGVASLVGTYGEMGTCWQIPGATEQDCWVECRTQLDALSEMHPEVQSCTACLDDSDCVVPTEPYCSPTSNECTGNLECDPLESEACPPGMGCHVTPEPDPVWACTNQTGAGGQNASCTTQSDCMSGFICSGTYECMGCCAVACRQDEPGVCGPSSNCADGPFEYPPGWGACG